MPDINCYNMDGTISKIKSGEQLKKEAIKWIKSLREITCDSGIDKDNWPQRNNCPNWVEIEDDYYSYCSCFSKNNSKIEWIKHFFNIEGSDLK